MRRTVGASLGLMAIGSLALAVLDEEPEAVAYPSVATLARDISIHGIGCDRLYPTRSVGLPLGRDWGTCLIGSSTVTLHTFGDPSWAGRFEEPSRRSGVTWVVGPDWLLATMNRSAAVQVASAIGGELVPET